jgi:hypothetical protein
MILPRRVHAADTLQYLGGGRRATTIGTDNDQGPTLVATIQGAFGVHSGYIQDVF